MKLGGVILCGGQSSRMGRPKLSLPVGGEVMLQRVLRILSETATPVAIVAAPDQSLPDVGDALVVRDAEAHLGPLAGIAGGLAALQSHVEAVYVSAVDAPLLRPEFVRMLASRLGDHEIVVPREQRFHHPLAAVYRTSIANRAAALVQQRQLRPLFLIESSRTLEIPVDTLRSIDPRLDSLRNINTPAEYTQLLAELGQ